MHVNDEKQLVDIWLTNAEKNDPVIRAGLRELYQRYNKQKYLVAVFASGGCDLADATSALLCYNRKRLAQREMQRGRRLGL